MADILIRGMEMPKEGEKILIASDGSVWANAWPTRGYMRMENVYAVPLLEGHGNLIDGHKLYRALFATECGNIAADRDSEGWPKVLTYETVKKAIQDATIIVPAEGGTDDEHV